MPALLRAQAAAEKFGLPIHAIGVGEGVDDLCKKFEKEHDDYSSIMTKALADRLAEAFAECLHKQAREDWGYSKDEKLSSDELIDEKYRGIRPAFGYPACPDHLVKKDMFDILQAGEIGMSVTESLAMLPASSPGVRESTVISPAYGLARGRAC